PRWWLLRGGPAAAEPWPPRARYVLSNAEPSADTFLGSRTPPPLDPLADALARARAARQAVRELDGQLPDQPLAVTVQRTADGDAITIPSTLDVAAFVIGDRTIVAALDEPDLLDRLRTAAASSSNPARAAGEGTHDHARWSGEPAFVCVSIGDDPLELARHAHRRAWTDKGGPWLG